MVTIAISRQRRLLKRIRSGLIRRTVKVFPGILKLRRLESSQSVAWDLDRTARELAARKNPGSSLASHPEAEIALAEGRFRRPVFIDHTEYQAPAEDVVFATVCTDKFAPGLEALILSLVQVYPGMANRFVVYHDGRLSPFVQERLRQIYPGFEFEQHDPGQYQVALGDADNHRRIGLLGYLSLKALEITGASYVVILDSDLLVLGDVSPLWTLGTIAVVPDAGQRPFASISRATGRAVINSGVISIPRHELGDPERVAAVLARVGEEQDPDIAKFADQKFWNLYFADRDVTLLPQNFNTIKNLVRIFYPEEMGAISVLHLTGAKPWIPLLHPSLVSEDDRTSYRDQKGNLAPVFRVWSERYRRLLLANRVAAFQRDCGDELDALEGLSAGRPLVLIGNGPSLSDTDLSAFEGYHKVAFNWFVNHSDFDEIAVDDLILPSHMLFGGWGTPEPKLPEAYLRALTAHAHRPRLWASYYFKPYLDSLPELAGYEKRYFLFENPLRRRIADTGVPGLDLRKPLTDANTGVLTAGVPLARHLGAKDIVLVGCDSNYASARGSYFYSAGEHHSASTDETELVKTWAAGGEGPFGYRVTGEALAEEGIRLRDATLGGSLELARIDLAGVRQLATPASPTA